MTERAPRGPVQFQREPHESEVRHRIRRNGNLHSCRDLAQNINGAGATFPYPIYSKWFSEYSQAHPNVHTSGLLNPSAPAAGIRQVTEGTVDSGASDGPMTDEQLGSAKSLR